VGHMKQPARGLFPACVPHPCGGSLGRVTGGVYSGAFWGNGCNYRNVTDRQHITTVCGIVFYFLVGKKQPLVVLNGGEGKTHARSNNRRGDYSRRVCPHPCGGCLERVPGGGL